MISICLMGNAISQTVISFLQYLGLYSKEVTIAVIGLDNAGKTTMLYRLINNKVIQMAPSLHVNEESFVYGGVSFKAYDIGGQESFRLLWKRFLGDVDAVLFLVDASDKQRFDEVKTELAHLSQYETIKTRPFGLVLNKCDIPTIPSVDSILEQIDSKVISSSNSKFSVFLTSSLRPETINGVFTWLTSVL